MHRASTVLFDNVAEMRAATPGLGKHYYGLHGTPTQWALAEALTELEPGAAGTFLYSSGLAALTAAIMTVVSTGDELLVTDSVYGPTRRFCEGLLKRYGVATRYYDPMIGGGIAELIGERTRAILLESPGIADHGGAGRARHLRGREGEGRRDPDRQYLGDAALLPGDRARASISRSSPAPNMSAAMPT